ncbi:pyridoxal-dependent decarboxylase [Novosphingobium sp.]|uniref:pyridoxal phosphate-dependent decarboxylase family protein n=1 Tax=Novosphingobium sp. TaxID=1874826 RepID=UPI0025E11A30|nr:pyridoxal-dependent decarboxylase [Novosphingobium sp.]MCC6925760.1 aspartate aminotransferase family protein [Novosphingobium sp.]
MRSNDNDFAALDLAARLAAEYRRAVAAAPANPAVGYGEVHARFDRPVPDEGCDALDLIAELDRGARDGLRPIVAPRFYAWVNGSSHLAGVAADWLTSAWGQNCAGIPMTPAGSAVEAVAARWLLELLDLPAESSVGLVSGATIANTVGLAAARGEQLRKAGWNVEDDGLYGAPPLRVLVGADAHNTVFSGLRYLGLGEKRVERIATDDLGRMLPADLERALKGHSGPLIVIGQAGQINTGVSDPFAETAPLVHAAGGWLHVDGAFGLWARASAQHRHLLAGIEQCDSWATDGHKWLQTPYDCGFVIVRHEAAHRQAMDMQASYLTRDDRSFRHPGAYVPELSRRSRGFAAWAMMRRLGRAGVARMVEEDVRLAQVMARGMAEIPGVSVLNQPELNQFVVRFGEEHGPEVADRLTQATVDQIQRDAIAFMGTALWRGRLVMRMSVCSIATTDEDAAITIEAVRSAWARVQAAE